MKGGEERSGDGEGRGKKGGKGDSILWGEHSSCGHEKAVGGDTDLGAERQGGIGQLEESGGAELKRSSKIGAGAIGGHGWRFLLSART